MRPVASPAWARFYNRVGSSFAVSVAPRIRRFYETTPVAQANRSLLDVCCGTGQLAPHFLDHGYRVTGIDLSPAMLEYARDNAGEHLATGRARFLLADAADFRVDREFGLATCTFDALNLLDDMNDLRRCFRCVFGTLVDEGVFAFDLMTPEGFRRDYNGIAVIDTADDLYVYRSVYNGAAKASSRMSGFVRRADGAWERYEEFRTATCFRLPAVLDALRETGWRRVWIADTEDLGAPIAEPERLPRVFFVAMV